MTEQFVRIDRDYVVKLQHDKPDARQYLCGYVSMKAPLHLVWSLAEETLGCVRQQDRALIDNVGMAINDIRGMTEGEHVLFIMRSVRILTIVSVDRVLMLEKD